MNTLPTRWTRLLATSLAGAALAAPLSASADLFHAVPDVRGNTTGTVVVAQPNPQTPTVRVNSPAELKMKLEDAQFTGRVIIPRDVTWSMTGFGNLELHAGMQLIGERGALGSRPLLYTSSPTIAGEDYNLFAVVGNNVRIEGLHLRGPANGSRSSSLPMVSGIKIVQTLAAETQDQSGFGVVIADNELEEWTKSGVQVESNVDSVGRERAGLTRVERNYIHNNARDGGGHGVGVSKGAYVTIEGNVFDFNRHAVEAEGYAGGYIARFNYALQGGFRQYGSVLGVNVPGGYYNQHFDAHGSHGGYGGKAGEYFDISFNTVRGEQEYYFLMTRPAFTLRGTPDIGVHFNGNVVVHESDEAVSFDGVDMVYSLFAAPRPKVLVENKFEAVGNQYDTDYSTELATGDFDGDGRTDAFIANGTAWFYSRGGKRPWEYLHGSTKRTHELAFADIDNDGVTDVLYRDSIGNLGSLKSGTVALVNFTTLPVPISELRVGDFDGDGKTDLFYTRGGQWWIWYGKTRVWTSAQTSSHAVTEFLFGEFDAVRGTDVAAVTSGMWAISSGGMGAWTKLNNKLSGSFTNAVAADFDGNGRSDIAFHDGRDWRVSIDGRAAVTLLRDSPSIEGVLSYPSLKSLLIGAFDGGTRAKVLAFERRLELGTNRNLTGERLLLWRGLGTGAAFSPHSDQNMR